MRTLSTFLLSLCLFSMRASSPIYFLVAPHAANSEMRESFVVPAIREDQIAQARDILAHKSKTQIVMVDAVYGSDGINRNYLITGFPIWNWHISEIVAFTDFVAEVFDAKPSFLETGSTPWPPEFPMVRIAPAAMTIVRELGPAPLELSITSTPTYTDLAWSTPGINWEYTVEFAIPQADSLLAYEWAPLPGIEWPIRTNRFQLKPDIAVNLFRVRAATVQTLPQQ